MNTQGIPVYGIRNQWPVYLKDWDFLKSSETFTMPLKNASNNRLLPPLDVDMRTEKPSRHSRLTDYEATDHLASGFNPDMFNSGSPLTDFETDDESGNQAEPAEDEGKSKEDIPKTPTAAGLPSLKATPLKQGGSASVAVSDGFASLT